jgi:hypothetical protein
MDPDADPVQRLAHQTVRHLTEDGDGVPDARAAVQDILGQYFVVCFISLQCCGSGAGAGADPDSLDPYVLGLPDPNSIVRDEVRIRIRNLLNLSKNSKKNLNFYCFVTFL